MKNIQLPSDQNSHREQYHDCKKKLTTYNQTTIDEFDKRKELLKELLGKAGEDSYIEPPFFCDYGKNIQVGAHFYANYGCVMVDTGTITIGNHVLLGPGVHIYCASHPLDASLRASGMEYIEDVVIKDHVWIGGNTTINPGVVIGEGTVIGSGSVVTHDIPANVVAAGNPCRVLRKIKEEEQETCKHTM